MSTLDHCNPNSSNSIQTQSDLNPAITTDTTITPSNSTLLDLLDQLTLTIQCLDDSLPEAQPDDPVYRTFLSLPNHTLPLLWTDLESSLNAIGRDDFLSADLKRGVFGLESVVPFLQHARRHPSWESYDILLQPILEQILRCVIGPLFILFLDASDYCVYSLMPTWLKLRTVHSARSLISFAHCYSRIHCLLLGPTRWPSERRDVYHALHAIDSYSKRSTLRFLDGSSRRFTATQQIDRSTSK